MRISGLLAWRVAWSPAGPFLAAGASETIGGVEGIYVMGADGSNARRLSPPDVVELQTRLVARWRMDRVRESP